MELLLKLKHKYWNKISVRTKRKHLNVSEYLIPDLCQDKRERSDVQTKRKIKMYRQEFDILNGQFFIFKLQKLSV